MIPAVPSASPWIERNGESAAATPFRQELEREPLRQDAKADVCIVGAGIAGLSTAYLLARDGRQVLVLDDGPIGGGQTQRTSAHLANALDDRYFELERIRGADVARLAAQSHTAAIAKIESIVLEEQIECDFRRVDGFLFAAPDESADVLQTELEAAHRASLQDVQRVDGGVHPGFVTGPCLRFPMQGQFHPLEYLAGLARAVEKLGGRICTGTHAAQITGGSSAHLKANNVHVRAEAIVVATNTPINDLIAIHTKQAPYVSYVIGMAVPRDSVCWALYWDTEHPYHYVRLQRFDRTSDLLIVGGEDHKLGQATDQSERFERLEAWARARCPQSGDVKYRWSGLVMETTDGLAFIGRNPMDEDNIYIATGDSGMGLTHGTIAGLLLTDLIQGRESPWAQVYEPSRKPAAGSAWRDFLTENVNVAQQYIRDWLSGGDVQTPQQVAPGCGAVIRRGLHKVAVYRDAAGSLSELSAVCPHLGCIVHWNDLEKCWDCPCHGSRFSATGEVVNGPANTPLQPADDELPSA